MGKLTVILLFMSGLLAGCAAGYCRTARATVENVFVYKPDGSLQCGQGKAVAPAEMAKELEGIKVISSRKQNDGMIHPTVCGAATGKINVYEIPAAELPLALTRNFKELKK